MRFTNSKSAIISFGLLVAGLVQAAPSNSSITSDPSCSYGQIMLPGSAGINMCYEEDSVHILDGCGVYDNNGTCIYCQQGKVMKQGVCREPKLSAHCVEVDYDSSVGLNPTNGMDRCRKCEDGYILVDDQNWFTFCTKFAAEANTDAANFNPVYFPFNNDYYCMDHKDNAPKGNGKTNSNEIILLAPCSQVTHSQDFVFATTDKSNLKNQKGVSLATWSNYMDESTTSVYIALRTDSPNDKDMSIAYQNNKLMYTAAKVPVCASVQDQGNNIITLNFAGNDNCAVVRFGDRFHHISSKGFYGQP